MDEKWQRKAPAFYAYTPSRPLCFVLRTLLTVWQNDVQKCLLTYKENSFDQSSLFLFLDSFFLL